MPLKPHIFKKILTKIEFHPTIYPSVNDNFEALKSSRWIWRGYSDKQNRPYYNSQPVYRLLFDHLITPLPKHWHVKPIYESHNRLDVNPWKYQLTNGFTEQNAEFDDLLELMETAPNNLSLPQLAEHFQWLFTDQELLSAAKLTHYKMEIS